MYREQHNTNFVRPGCGLYVMRKLARCELALRVSQVSRSLLEGLLSHTAGYYQLTH